MRNYSTISFLGLWEKIHNPNFKPIEFDRFKLEAGDNAFTLTPQQWIKSTDAIGIISKAGRYGGTYAHTDAVKEFLITPSLSPQEMTYTYASEADILNMALFGKTAAQWRNENGINGKNPNIREFASAEELVVLINLENPREVEKRIHSIIDRVDDSLHAREQLNNGRIREREFFKFSPETAYGIFKDIASLRGDENKLKLYTPTYEESQEQEIAERRTKRSNNSFKLLNLGVGEEVVFLYDDTISAKVVNEKNKVEYEGEFYSVTGLACKLLIERYGWSENLHVNGWMYFTKDGISLSDLRDRIENVEEE